MPCDGGPAGGPRLPSCCAGIAAALGGVPAACCGGAGRSAGKISQADFERLISFLDGVPVLRKHLPRAELPRVAEAFKQREYQPGEKVIDQGCLGNCLFIIKSGEASVVVEDKEGSDSERATLYALDYFGGHSLVERRLNVATIIAKGNSPLVALCMYREEFEALGLHKFLKFPRRPAIYEGRRTDVACEKHAKVGDGCQQNGEKLQEADVETVAKAVRSNGNLRQAFSIKEGDAKLDVLARTAHRRRVRAGEYLTRAGELPEVLYIVAGGSFDITSGSASEHKSVEATIQNLTKVQQRMDAKQRFVAQLERSSGKPKAASGGGSRSTSVRMERKPRGSRSIDVFRATSWVGGRTSTPISGVAQFKAGDAIARVVFGTTALTQQVGRIVKVVNFGLDGRVEVEWDGPGRVREVVRACELRPAKDMTASVGKLTRGMCYGDFSLLYNTRLTTNCRAKMDAEVFAIPRAAFKEVFSRKSPQLEDHIRLLDDCHLFNPLVRSERMEIARSAACVLEFSPGERVLQQGEELKEMFLYIIKGGSCAIRSDSSPGGPAPTDLATLGRAGHFGERSIFRNERRSEFSVDAGPDGLVCLAVHEEIFKKFLDHYDVGGASGNNAGGVDTGTPDFQADLVQYTRLLPTNKNQIDVPLANLEKVDLLGEGGFGSVFLVENVLDRKAYALKRLSKGFVVKAKAQTQVALERDLLAMVDSDFIIKLYKTYKDHEYVYMLLELCDGGHLYQLIADARQAGIALMPTAVMFYVASVTCALGHLHERHIAYRDLKAENVLLDKGGFVKLCDMGFAKFVLDKTHTLLGTPEYMAPEMIDTPHAHDHTVDWWALGVLTFELLTGQDPWNDYGMEGEDPMAQLLAIRDSHDEGIPERLIPRAQSAALAFIKRLLCVGAKRRLGSVGGAAQVQQDGWFTSKKFDFPALLRKEVRPPVPPRTRSEMADSVPAELNRVPASRVLETDESLFAPAPSDAGDWDSAF